MSRRREATKVRSTEAQIATSLELSVPIWTLSFETATPPLLSPQKGLMIGDFSFNPYGPAGSPPYYYESREQVHAHFAQLPAAYNFAKLP